MPNASLMPACAVINLLDFQTGRTHALDVNPHAHRNSCKEKPEPCTSQTLSGIWKCTIRVLQTLSCMENLKLETIYITIWREEKLKPLELQVFLHFVCNIHLQHSLEISQLSFKESAIADFAVYH